MAGRTNRDRERIERLRSLHGGLIVYINLPSVLDLLADNLALTGALLPFLGPGAVPSTREKMRDEWIAAVERSRTAVAATLTELEQWAVRDLPVTSESRH